MRSQGSRPFALTLLLVVVTMAAGLTVRFVPLGLPSVVVKYGGSMLWALLIYWVMSALLPSLRLPAVAFLTATLTTAVELIKLDRFPALDAFRLTLPGILLLGRVFSGWDILVYWLATSIGFLMDKRIRCTAK